MHEQFGALASYHMNAELKKSKTLRGKYQIKKNIYVTCYVDVVEANDQGIRAFIGLKRLSDTIVATGTKIYFNAESINKINERRSNSFDVFSVTVLDLEDLDGKPLHVCTPILKEKRTNLRAAERVKTEFYVHMAGTGASFLAKNGTLNGLTLLYKSKKAVLSLTLNTCYDFDIAYKGKNYAFNGEVRHIQYDWKTHDHLIGIYFKKLPGEQETVLNLLLDPNYKVDLTAKQTIDTAAGKISRDS